MKKKSRFQELLDDASLLRRCVIFVWKRRRTYIKYMLIGAVLSLVVSFSIPKSYSSSVVLAPETQGGALEGLSGLASMAGINMGNMGQDAYTVDLYPTIVSSLDFSLALKDIKVKSSKLGINTTYGEYILKHKSEAWWMYPVKWVRTLIGKLRPSDKPLGDNGGDADRLRYVTKQDYNLALVIQQSVRCAVEKLTGVISVTVTEQDPEIAAIVADSVVNKLSGFILDYRTRKARADYEYFASVCDSTKRTYLDVQAKYADYARKHTAVTSPAHQAQMTFLENEVSLAYSAYSAMMGQMQMAQAKILETTPVYTVIESAYVPLYAGAPKKILILLVFVFLAFAAATVKLVYGEILSKQWRNEEV